MTAKSISSIVSFTLMVLFSAICVFHFLALFQVIPFDILWGGRLKSKEEMWVFESISILVNFLMLGVVLIYRGAIQIGISKKSLRFSLWAMAVLFFINTIGNLFAINKWEKIIYLVKLKYDVASQLTLYLISYSVILSVTWPRCNIV